MMNGDRHRVNVRNGQVHIAGRRVLMYDLRGWNGIAQVIMPALPVSEYKPQGHSANTGTMPAAILKTPPHQPVLLPYPML